MQAVERHRYIVEKVNTSEAVDVDVLAEVFNVSTMTVRRDLSELDRKGLVLRTHGGAVKPEVVQHILSNFDLKVNQNKIDKQEICKAAASNIEENDIIFIDCGTTLFHMCRYIVGFKNIRVITNSLPVVSELLNYPSIKINLIGGEVDSHRKAVYGKLAEQSIKDYHANKAFIGADGVSVSGGLSTYDEKESSITKNMAACADKVFLLCDSSKIEKNAFVKFSPLNTIHYLVTDKHVSEETIRLYQENNVKVVC